MIPSFRFIFAKHFLEQEMPFEILLNFPRGSVHFAGERLRCFITVRNVATTAKNVAIAADNELESSTDASNSNGNDANVSAAAPPLTTSDKNILALLGVHVYTQCIFVEQRAQPPKRAPYDVKPLPATAANNTYSTFNAGSGKSTITSMHAFQCAESISAAASSNIFIVDESERQILACNTHFGPGSARTYVFETIIPPTTPPSFRGHFVKYYCRVAIGVQTVSIPIQVFRTNLWIMPCPPAVRRSLVRSSIPNTTTMDAVDDDGSSINNTGSSRKSYNKDDIIQLVDDLSARRRQPLEYSIKTAQGLRVGSLLLPKTSFKIGEDIAGTFDFTDSQVSCAQVVVVLQATERIPPECAINEANSTITTDYGTDKTFCIASVQSQFCLPIPLQVTPTFATDVVQLSWSLQFTFMLSDEKILYDVPAVPDRAASVLWTPPDRVDVKPLEWQLPLEIWPCDPEHVASVHSPEMFLGSIVLRLL